MLTPCVGATEGAKLTVSFDLAAVQKKRILDGERADVIILTRAMMEDLAKQNKLAPGNIVNVAGTPVALAARAGVPPSAWCDEQNTFSGWRRAGIFGADPAVFR